MEIFSIKRNPKQDRFSEEMTELGTYRSRHSQVFLLIFRRKSDWKRTFLAWILVLQKLLNLESSWTKYISLKMKPYIQVLMCLLCKAIYIYSVSEQIYASLGEKPEGLGNLKHKQKSALILTQSFRGKTWAWSYFHGLVTSLNWLFLVHRHWCNCFIS